MKHNKQQQKKKSYFVSKVIRVDGIETNSKCYYM